MMDSCRYAKIDVAPYSDGSGHHTTVTGEVGECGEKTFSIEVVYRLEAAHWPELKKAIEDVLELLEAAPEPQEAT